MWWQVKTTLIPRRFETTRANETPFSSEYGTWVMSLPLSSECGTRTTVTARFWPWLSGESPPAFLAREDLVALLKRFMVCRHRGPRELLDVVLVVAYTSLRKLMPAYGRIVVGHYRELSALMRRQGGEREPAE